MTMTRRAQPLDAGECILRLLAEERNLLNYVLKRAQENPKLFGGGHCPHHIQRKLSTGDDGIRLKRDEREVLHHVLNRAMRNPEIFAGHQESLGLYFRQSIGRIKNKLPKQGSGTYGD